MKPKDSASAAAPATEKTGKAEKTVIIKALTGWKTHAGRWLQLAVTVGLFAGLLLIAQAWLLAKTVNAVVFDDAHLTDVQPYLWAMLGIFLLRAVLVWLSEQTAFQAATQVKLALRQHLYAHVRQLGPAWLSNERSGDIINTLSDGIEALEAYYARYLPIMTLVALVPLAILVFVLGSDGWSALIMLVTAPLIPLFMIMVGKGAEKRNQQQWRTLARMSAHFLDTLQGLTTLRLFNASRREADMIANVSEQYRLRSMSVLRVAFLSSFLLEFLATVSIALVAVWIGFRLFWGEMDFFYGFFVLLLAPEFYLPLRTMGTHYHARMEAIGAAERMVEILNTPLPENTAQQQTLQQTLQHTPQTSVLPDLRTQTISLQHLHFSYPDGRRALNDTDLVIHPGETLALVGSSGSGKTTLINVLMGFLHPQQGRILVGDTPLNQLAMETWRQQLAWLPQQSRLFPGTVADNIRLGVPDASDEHVTHAARLAQADDFIQSLPNGYNTSIGEAGQGLSGGQVQRIALARAFLRDAPLVILDEATANLDQRSETRIQHALQTLAQDRTMVMIAHRLRTVQQADRIAVMDQGEITQVGTHHELEQHCTVYQQMLAAYGDQA